MIERMTAGLRTLGPVRTTFLASLLLSLVALQGQLVNRDGIYYLERARAILEGELADGILPGEWGFLPVLIAAFSAATRFGPETAAHILNALFLAGACALLVAWVRRRDPETAWAACLVVLAMPAYNQYRHEILREFGFWYFCLLGLWLAMRWDETQHRRDAIFCQLALAAAVLFRLEAAAFYPALMIWQVFSASPGERLRRVLTISMLPLVCVALALLLYGTGLLTPPSRLVYYLEAANPLHKLKLFGEAAGRLTESVLNKYSREEAGYVLFFGLLSIIPVKFMKMAGVFLLPLAYQVSIRPARGWLARWQPLPWALLAYLLVLVAFVTHQFFLVGRYVSMLHWLAVPMVAGGLALLLQRFPRWRMLFVALALTTMASNVVSLSPRKTHIVDAGRWMSNNVADHGQVCLTSSRIAYYAGWPSNDIVFESERLKGALDAARCAWVAVETKGKEENMEAWMKANRLVEVKRFAARTGEAVLIARRNE